MSYLPYAEALKKTVDLKECNGCDGLCFAYEGEIAIPFCKYKWFGVTPKECKMESETVAVYKAERFWKYK